jgi:hypothetical protein
MMDDGFYANEGTLCSLSIRRLLMHSNRGFRADSDETKKNLVVGPAFMCYWVESSPGKARPISFSFLTWRAMRNGKG